MRADSRRKAVEEAPVEQGPARTVFETPHDDYTRALLAAAFDLEARETE